MATQAWSRAAAGVRAADTPGAGGTGENTCEEIGAGVASTTS